MGKFIDLTGRIFGRLFVIERVFDRPTNKVWWICRCDCGNSMVSSGSDLKSGNTRSCGCLRSEFTSKRTLIPISGQRFGRLLVGKETQRRKQRIFRLCVCDCGKVLWVLTGSLTSGNTTSCGCWKSESVSKRSLKTLSGQRFGRLSVGEEMERRKQGVFWLCECDCGNALWVDAGALTTGNTKSCGCWKNELMSDLGRRNKGKTKADALIRNPTYRIWAYIKTRCYNPNATGYANYGGKGITVCERWRTSFRAFQEDMGARPSSKHSIDRYPNGYGNYEPGNCRWATAKEQAENKPSTVFVTVDGITDNLKTTARRVGIAAKTLRLWLSRGYSAQEIVDSWRQNREGKGRLFRKALKSGLGGGQ